MMPLYMTMILFDNVIDVPLRTYLYFRILLLVIAIQGTLVGS
jgi:hypothetical protein